MITIQAVVRACNERPYVRVAIPMHAPAPAVVKPVISMHGVLVLPRFILNLEKLERQGLAGERNLRHGVTCCADIVVVALQFHHGVKLKEK